jgi:ubiquinone/menaquinone biosynthesis C-methylase UbiE
MASQEPEYFCHDYDLYTWYKTGNTQWIERGLHAQRVIKQGDHVLDLCCGEGFYSYYFFRSTSGSVDAVDYSMSALNYAKKWHSSPNIKYHQIDVITQPFLSQKYDVIVWNAFLDYFSTEDIGVIMKKIRDAIGNNGIFVGHVVKSGEQVSGYRKDSFNIYTENDLSRLLSTYFTVVKIESSTHGDRTSYYFTAK